MAAFAPTGVEFIAQGINQYLNNLKKANNAQGKLGDSASNLSKGIGGLGKTLANVGIIASGAALGGIVTLAAGIVASTQTAISFESAFTGVVKTTDGLTDSVGNLNVAGLELRKGFVDLSKEVPIAFEELAAIGELGGQLGIGKDALLDFTSTIANLGVTTNLTTEEAATNLARFQNIFSVASDDMGENTQRLGSTLVELGNNFATTERDILSMGLRLAGAGNIVGFTQDEVFGLAAALSSVGVEAEAGGTATQKVLLSINNAVNATATGFVDNTKAIEKNIERLTSLNAQLVRAEAQTGLTGDQILQMRDDFIAAGGTAEEFGRQLGDTQRQKLFTAALAVRKLTEETQLLRDAQGQPIDSGELAKFAQVAGLSASEFEKAWQEDAARAFQLFVEGLGKEGDNAQKVLEDLGLADQRLVRAFLSLSNAGDLLNISLNASSKGFEENSASAKEAEQRYATTESQLLILKNTFRALGDTIGSRFLPFVNKLIIGAKNIVDKFSKPVEKALDKVIGAFERFGARGASTSILGLLGFDPDEIASINTVLFDAIITPISNFFDNLPGLISDLKSGFESGTILQDLFDVNTFAELVVNFVTELPAILGLITKTIQAFFISQSENVKNSILDFLGVETFQELFNNIVAALPGQMTTITTTLIAFIQNQVPVIQTEIQSWISTFLDWVNVAAIELFNKLGILIAVIISWANSGETQAQLTNMGKALGDVIVTGIGFLLENEARVVEILLKLTGTLAAGVLAITGVLIGIGGQIVAGIIAGILESLGADEIEVLTISELGNTYSRIGANALLAAKVIGLDIILGIIGGLEDGIDQLTTTLEQIGFIITNTVSETLGIQSPSTVFFTIGTNIIQGLIDGILALTPEIPALLSSVFDGISSLFSGLFGDDNGEGVQLIDFSGLLTSIQETLPLAILTLGEIFTLFFENTRLGLESIMLATQNNIMTFIELTDVTIPNLDQGFTLAANNINLNLKTILLAVQKIDNALLKIIKPTLPTLQSVMKIVTNDMIKQFNLVTLSINDTSNAVEIFKGPLKAALEILKDMAKEAQKIRNALSGLNLGIGFNSGIGLNNGIGLQDGLGLGAKVPGTGNKDTFGPIFLTPGEEILVAPKSTSIDEIVASRLPTQAPQVTINATFNTPMDLAVFEQIAINAINEALQ